jgi:hypothetical protein
MAVEPGAGPSLVRGRTDFWRLPIFVQRDSTQAQAVSTTGAIFVFGGYHVCFRPDEAKEQSSHNARFYQPHPKSGSSCRKLRENCRARTLTPARASANNRLPGSILYLLLGSKFKKR